MFAPASVERGTDVGAKTIRASGRLSMGVPRLDNMLGGPTADAAIHRWSQGQSGSGKGILAASVHAEGGRCGETGVIAAFEQRPMQSRSRTAAGLIDRALAALVESRALNLSIDEVLLLLLSEVRRKGASRW